MGCTTPEGKACPVSGDNYDSKNDGFVRLPHELADKYGIKRDENYWVKVDKNNGNIQLWNEEWGAHKDRDLATLNPEDGTITPNHAWLGQGVHDKEWAMLQDPKAIQFFKTQGQKVATKGKIQDGMDAEQAAAEATDLVDHTATGTQDTAQELEVNPGTKKDFGKGLKYPSTLDPKRQDTILFSMLEYSPKELTAGGGLLGSGDRKDRKSIGSVILPIPNGIKDSDKVEWGADSMDAATMALAAVAYEVINDGTGAAKDELNKVIGGMKGIGGGNIKEAFAGKFAGAAVGKDKGKFMSRATGQVMNPNMELLFNGPSLRDFSFTFLLAPRDHKEAMVVMKIIRFFKQGMLPIRSKSNLFLKAPNTFQLTYQNKGENHPYLNSFKECALKTCDVNYTPENSYSTYTDGVMTAYSMTLSFGELEPIYNDDYGTGDAENLNFVEGATPATTGTDTATTNASTNTLTAQAAGPKLTPPPPAKTGPSGKPLTAQQTMRQKINNQP